MKGLFALCAAQMITVMVNRRSEKRINIRLDRLYLLYFFFELRTFIIEPLLLFKKSLLFRLQRLQARQFFISLHGKLYEAKPPVDANNPELRKFVEMCFDPESPMNEKLKEAMLKMLGEAKT